MAGPVTELAAGAPLTVTALVALTDPQEFVRLTATFPDAAPAGHEVLMDVVPCPAVMVTPDGTVQL